jgi:CRISPR-associated protein Cas5t
MNTFWLRIRAPFAAFRGFQAGVYRSSSPVMPPSTAYGLVLNLAGIEMRGASDKGITLIRRESPRLRIAIGMIRAAERNSLYQQLHGYRVGTDERTKIMAALTKGAKYQIVPVRREILVNYEGVIGVQTSDESLCGRVERGLLGKLEDPRYGLPFAGDNNFLFDRIELAKEQPIDILWYARFEADEKPRKGACRLTVGIDRADNSRTTSLIYAPTSEFSEATWTWTPMEPATVR